MDALEEPLRDATNCSADQKMISIHACLSRSPTAILLESCRPLGNIKRLLGCYMTARRCAIKSVVVLIVVDNPPLLPRMRTPVHRRVVLNLFR